MRPSSARGPWFGRFMARGGALRPLGQQGTLVTTEEAFDESFIARFP